MGNIDDYGIEHGSNSFNDRLFIVPISYEQNKLDNNRPLASGAVGDLTSKIVPRDQQLVSKPKTHTWRKIKTHKTTSMAGADLAATDMR